MIINFESTTISLIETNKIGEVHFDDLDITLMSLLAKGYEVTSRLLGDDIVQVVITNI